MTINTTEQLIEEFRAGHMVVLIDDEDRENEGDLVMSASLVTPEAINFMARYARGLICLPMTKERIDQLSLWLMVGENTEAQGTQFTVSIDAAEGISTGISATDRATTILAAVAEHAKPSDFVHPGHVFPLQAERGGVLTRAGHTEAGCDLARLAGLEPAAVVVEIMNEDGTMARRPDLEKFSAEHGLKMGTIADLIEYRMLNEKTVERIGECAMPTHYGEFRLISFQDRLDGGVHLALVAGDIEKDTAVLIRVHVQDPLADLTGSARADTGMPISAALERISAEGNGVLVILRNQWSNAELIHRLKRYELEDQGTEFPGQDHVEDLRTYGLGAQILLDLGIRRMRIIGAPRKIHGLSGFGLEVDEYV